MTKSRNVIASGPKNAKNAMRPDAAPACAAGSYLSAASATIAMISWSVVSRSATSTSGT